MSEEYREEKIQCRECDYVQIMVLPIDCDDTFFRCYNCKRTVAQIICKECGEEDWQCEDCFNAVVSS